MTFAYVCRKCGTAVEVERLLADNTRHMVDKKVCGTLRRDWKAGHVNIARHNLRNAR